MVAVLADQGLPGATGQRAPSFVVRTAWGLGHTHPPMYGEPQGETSHVSSVGLVCARAGGGFVRFRHRRVRMFG